MEPKRMISCCELSEQKSVSKKSSRKWVGVVSMLSAFFAASFAGVGCLGCIPLIGAILATTSAATFLDDHLVGLQLGFIAVSTVFSIVYFSKRRTSGFKNFFALALYGFLVFNAIYFENRTYALIATLLLVLVHTAGFAKPKTRDLIQVVYFPDCDNYKVLKDSLIARGIKNFEEINSETLTPESPYQGYSSPSLLINQELILGAKVADHSLSCSYLTADETKRAVNWVPLQS